MDQPTLQVTQFHALQDYASTFERMRQFTNERHNDDVTRCGYLATLLFTRKDLLAKQNIFSQACHTHSKP